MLSSWFGLLDRCDKTKRKTGQKDKGTEKWIFGLRLPFGVADQQGFFCPYLSVDLQDIPL
jgi:hypothetical protein